MDFTRNIKRGMTGDDVRAVKERLFALGFYSTKITKLTNSTFGSDSVAAAKRFQLKNGLEADGIVGKLTWPVLFGENPDVDAPITDDQGANVNPLVEKMRQLCQTEVDNGSIYVWASGGELGTSVNEDWIRTKENRCSGGANFDRAYRLWKKRIDAGNTLFRCFDCSGFVSWILRKLGVFNGRRDCDGLYSLSTPLDSPLDGCLLFRQSSSNPNDETHVGLYIGGYAYHAKGRDVGVAKEKYKASYWHKIAWFKAIPR
jgi:hypothetical protein